MEERCAEGDIGCWLLVIRLSLVSHAVIAVATLWHGERKTVRAAPPNIVGLAQARRAVPKTHRRYESRHRHRDADCEVREACGTRRRIASADPASASLADVCG